jgi:hypothetical protein
MGLSVEHQDAIWLGFHAGESIRGRRPKSFMLATSPPLGAEVEKTWIWTGHRGRSASAYLLTTQRITRCESITRRSTTVSKSVARKTDSASSYRSADTERQSSDGIETPLRIKTMTQIAERPFAADDSTNPNNCEWDLASGVACCRRNRAWPVRVPDQMPCVYLCCHRGADRAGPRTVVRLKFCRTPRDEVLDTAGLADAAVAHPFMATKRPELLLPLLTAFLH